MAQPGFCLISKATRKQAGAMDHQGKYRQAAKLSAAIKISDAKNFIVYRLTGREFTAAMINLF